VGRQPELGAPAIRRLPVLTGRAWTFADELAATDILPERFAALSPADAAQHLFADLDAGLAASLAPGDVLVAGQSLGIGAGGAAAARALGAAGIVAVIAGSFAAGFEACVLAAGLPPLEVDAPATFHTGQHVRLNLEGGTIANLSSGDRQPVRNLTEERLAHLRELIGR
jgi:3-isopropylmalate/(R)-2-methylmalate dehydratase small subunit